MTNEETIEYFEQALDRAKDNKYPEIYPQDVEYVETAIKALEKQISIKKKIEFEFNWLEDVYREDGYISIVNLNIAKSGLMKEVEE